MNVWERIKKAAAEYDALSEETKAELEELWALTDGRKLSAAEKARVDELQAKVQGAK